MPGPAPIFVIVLSAGAGTRMKSKTNKILHPIGGLSMVGHALAAARGLDADQVVAVIGHDRDPVGAHLSALDPGVLLAEQLEQNGTGHAVQVGLDAITDELTGTVVVTYGDVPLLQAATLRALVAEHRTHGRAVSVLTAEVPDPTGYGRIVRDAGGQVERIVEQKDATPEQLSIAEVNSGIFAFDAAFLADAIGRVGTDNAQGEIYLTDVVAIARGDGRDVGAYVIDDIWQTEGANDRAQLARLGAELNRRTLDHWMRAGVTVVDPATTWIDVTATLAPDVTVLPGVQLHGTTSIAEGARIGPDTTLTDVEVGAGATVIRTHGSESVIGRDASVGPFAYLRPGTRLGVAGKIGTFVETKKAEIGDGAKVPHLSYVGDAVIGESSNIGAGTIFANYDGVNKLSTVVGAHCRTSSHNVFVAPVSIGDGAFTGAGTTVREDVPPGSLAVSGGRQRNIEGWVAAKRPGSAADEAARRSVAPEQDNQKSGKPQEGKS